MVTFIPTSNWGCSAPRLWLPRFSLLEDNSDHIMRYPSWYPQSKDATVNTLIRIRVFQLKSVLKIQKRVRNRKLVALAMKGLVLFYAKIFVEYIQFLIRCGKGNIS